MDGEWHDLDVRRCVVDVCHDEALRAKWSRYHLARDAMRREALAGATLSLAERVSAALEREPAYSNVTAIGGAPGVRAAERAGAGDDGIAVAGAAAGADGAPAADGEVALRADTGRRGGRGALRTVATGFGLAASAALVTVFALGAWRGGPSGDPPGGAPVQLATAPSSGTIETAANGGGAAENVVADDAFSRQIPGAPLPEVELVANTGAYWATPGSAMRRAGSEERLNAFLSQHIENSPTAERQGMLPYSRLVGYDERASER